MVAFPAHGQFKSPNVDGIKPTDYTNPRQDTIFIFNQKPVEKKGHLSLEYHPVSASTVYKWYRYNYQNNAFEDTPFETITAASTEIDTLSQGGYMVKVESGAERDSFVAWVYLNPCFELKLQKNNNGAVYPNHRFCDRTDFWIDSNTPVQQSSFTYYNPISKMRYMLDNVISFTARQGTGVPLQATLRSQGGQQYFRIYTPPSQDTKFYFRGEDISGWEQNDEIMYETILPQAKMTVELPEVDPTSAPIEAKFTSQSENATEYLWRFGDGDSVMYQRGDIIPDTVKHIYTIPNEKPYTAILFVTSIYQCTDSASKEITVSPSKLDRPNVFTPNGDGINDYFKPENLSIRRFELSIYTRSGRRVYHHKGADLRSWQGWDGRIENGGKNAAEGVYYFVLRATGWDDVDYGWKKKDKSSSVYKGFVYLYR
jgi:gliding motility-associated-like protein